MNVKYQIFVSSTYEDLRDERSEIIKACLNMGHIPVGMEMFNAADEEQWQVITRTIDQCDYYVVIVAHRYGSMADGISYTEKEYDYATEKGVPVLGFVIGDQAKWPSKFMDHDQPALDALQRFKSKIKQKMVRFWNEAADLQAHFAMSLSTIINLNPQRGWVRAPGDSEIDIAETISKLTNENTRLRGQVDKLSLEKDQIDQVSYAINQIDMFSYEDKNGSKVNTCNLFIYVADLAHFQKSIFLNGQSLDVRFSLPEESGVKFITQLDFLGVLEIWEGQSRVNVVEPKIRLTPLGKGVYFKLVFGKDTPFIQSAKMR